MIPIGILAVALLVVVGGVFVARLHPFVVLIAAAFVVALLTPGATISAGQRVAEGFGKTALHIGVVVAMASILGNCLSAAGAAERIVASLHDLLGERRTAAALLVAGFVLGIPMFAESVFFLLLPLARAAWDRTGRHYLLNVLAAVAGATMTHSLVPPTPGPLFVADAFAVDLATMIGVGSLVSFPASLAGLAYAHWADRRWPTQPSPTQTDTGHDAVTSTRTIDRLPSLWASLMPIVVPVALISLEALSRSADGCLPPGLVPLVRLAGDSSMAMTIAAFLAMAVLGATARSMTAVRTTVARAIGAAGGVLLIVAAGGALGGSLQAAGLADTMSDIAPADGLSMLVAAWLMTAAIRIAQGSATVAMITAAGVLGPAVVAGTAGCHPVYVAVAIGCGSKLGLWMNDGGFWVITSMSGMSEARTLKTASVMLGIEGSVGLLITLALATLVPLG